MEAPAFWRVVSAVSANARTYEWCQRCLLQEISAVTTYLGESGTFGDLLHTIDERAEIGRCYIRIADELD